MSHKILTSEEFSGRGSTCHNNVEGKSSIDFRPSSLESTLT